LTEKDAGRLFLFKAVIYAAPIVITLKQGVCVITVFPVYPVVPPALSGKKAAG
jgi:hypothetical protein